MSIVSSSVSYPMYERFKRQARQLDKIIDNKIIALASADAHSREILNLYEFLKETKIQAMEYTTIPGFADAARAVEHDDTYDVIAEIGTLNTQIAAAMTWIDTNFPKSGDYLLFCQIVDEQIVLRSFTPAQTGGLRTALQAIADAIN